MKRRTTFVRFLAICWATLQLASPAISAVADGIAAREGATSALSHVESTTTAGCPEVHAVDCAVCRYLSHATTDVPQQGWSLALAGESVEPQASLFTARSGTVVLPHGRAPPVI